MPIALLLDTQTFRDWFTKTNEIINDLNANTLIAGSVATGAFATSGSLQVVNTFFANSTLVDLRGNTTVTANLTVASTCNVWNFAAGTVILQPLNGTTVNSQILFTATAPATFRGIISANANVTVTAALTTVTGNSLFTGYLTSAGGPIICQQVLFGSANAMAANVSLSSPEYDDFGTGGLEGCAILNLTPTINTVFTGIVAPTTVSTGGRLLFIQNLSGTYTVQLASANTASAVNNRFKMNADAAFNILPYQSIALVYNTTTHEWRPVSSPVPLVDLSNLNASNLTSGTVPTGRFPATLPALNGSLLTSLNASALASGTIPNGQFPATLPVTSGINLTSLNASAIASGLVATPRLASGSAGSTNVLRGDQVWAQIVDAQIASAAAISWSKVSKATSSLADFATRSASDLTSGTLPDAQFPTTLPAISGINLTHLNIGILWGSPIAFPVDGSTFTNANDGIVYAYNGNNEGGQYVCGGSTYGYISETDTTDSCAFPYFHGQAATLTPFGGSGLSAVFVPNVGF
jgi:hypothetical protein